MLNQAYQAIMSDIWIYGHFWNTFIHMVKDCIQIILIVKILMPLLIGEWIIILVVIDCHDSHIIQFTYYVMNYNISFGGNISKQFHKGSILKRHWNMKSFYLSGYTDDDVTWTWSWVCQTLQEDSPTA